MTATTSALYERHLTPALEAALDDTPVVLVVGPGRRARRRSARLVAERRGARLLSLTTRRRWRPPARTPPVSSRRLDTRSSSTRSRRRRAVAGDQARGRSPARCGRFLLTGSADVLALPVYQSHSPDAWRC